MLHDTRATVVLNMSYAERLHTADTMAVMDSGNNIRHCLKSERFFPHGLV